MAHSLPSPSAVQPTTSTPRPHARRRRSHRRKHTYGRLLAYTATLVLVAGLAGALAFVAVERSRAHATGESASVTDTADTLTSESIADAEPASEGRPVYRHSVVPGGVYSVEEFKDAVSRDPVVAAHYRPVNIKALHVEKLTASRSMYVSYRVGDQIYWTRHRVQLRAGETVLTDGHTMIRGRCGNCVSPDEQDAVAENEPAATELDQIERPGPLQVAAVPPVGNGILPSRGLPSALPPAPPSDGGVPYGALVAPLYGALAGGSPGPAGTPADENAGPVPPIDVPIVPGTPTTPGSPDTPGTPGTPGSPAPAPPDSPFPPIGGVPPGGPSYPPPGGEIPLLPVPEPGTFVLLGTGLAGVAARYLKRRGKESGVRNQESGLGQDSGSANQEVSTDGR